MSRISDDLSTGFDRDRNRRKREMTNNKNLKGKFHMRIYLRDIFGFAKHQEKATYGLGYKLTLTRNSDNAVLQKTNATPIGKTKIISLVWYVPHYTASPKEQGILMNQIQDKIPTELRYVEKSVFIKELNTQNLWSFELGTQEEINVPICFIVGFQQSDRQNDQNLNNDSFSRPPVTSAQCFIGTEKYPDTAILLNYNDYDFSEGYGLIKQAFKDLTKDDMLEPCRGDNDYRSNNTGNNIGYNLYVSDIR